MALEGQAIPKEVQEMMSEVSGILANPGGSDSERAARIFKMGDDPTILNDLSSLIARHHTGAHPAATAYIVSHLRDQLADVLRDPDKLQEDLNKNQELLNQMRLQYEGSMKTWTLPVGHPHHETLKAIMEANSFTASPEGLETFVRGLNKRKMATIDRMKEDPNSIQKLVPVLDMPYLDYYETAEDAKSGYKTKMKPGLITLTNEIFKSKGLNEMWIDSSDNQYLKEYWQAEDDKRIKPRHANGGKVTVELKWSIQEGADEPAAAKYADGTTDDVNADFGDRIKKAREQGVETTYITHIASQLLKLSTGDEAWQSTLLPGDELKDGRVGRLNWDPSNRELDADWLNAHDQNFNASVRALVM